MNGDETSGVRSGSVTRVPGPLIAGAPGQRAQDAPAGGDPLSGDGHQQGRRDLAAEWRGSEQSFQRHDWNGDRVLSGNEVRIGASREFGEEGDDYDQERPEFRNWTERGFTNLDRNRDGRIARAEWFYDREGFIRADRNGDNALTREEFLSGDVDVDREDRFENLDANRNGRIERAEWHASRDAFTWLDRNSDGVLSRQEVVGDDAQQADLFARPGRQQRRR